MNDFLTNKLRFLESRLVRYQQLIDEAFSKVKESSSQVRKTVRDTGDCNMDDYEEVYHDFNYAIKRMNECVELAQKVYDDHIEHFEHDLNRYLEATDAPVYMDGIDETTAEEWA